MNLFSKQNCVKVIGLGILAMTVLVAFEIVWYSLELVSDGFPVETIVNGTLPAGYYSVGQGSMFNIIQLFIQVGFFFVIGIGLLSTLYLRTPNKA